MILGLKGLIKAEALVHQRVPSSQRVYSRDLRPRRIDFGRWLTQFEWSVVLNLSNVQEKFDLFSSMITDAVNRYLPLKRVKSCVNEKAWIPPNLKGKRFPRVQTLAC